MVFQTLSAWLLQVDRILDAYADEPLLVPQKQKSVFFTDTVSALSRAPAWPWTLLAGLALLVVVHYTPFGSEAARDPPRPYTVPPPSLPATVTYVESSALRDADGGGGSAIRCYAPATGQFLGLVNPATPAGIDRAVAAAQAAQTVWAATTTFRARRAVLRSLLQHVLDHQDVLCRVACLDSGKLPLDAALGEVFVVAARIRWTLRYGEAALRPSRRPAAPSWLLMPHKRNTVVYEPLGVVAALVSWNYPLHNLLAPIVSALFAGNAIVVKASEQTAWSAQYFAGLARGALAAHGHDPALVQTVVCWPATAAHLTRHPGIAHITFIGSQAVARQVATSAAQALTPVCAELGGKDPFVVLDSVGLGSRLPAVAATLLRGTFQSSGQNCIGAERVIAAPAVYEPLLALVAEQVAGLRVGGMGPRVHIGDRQDDDNDDDETSDHYDMGAMISDANFARLEALVADAVRHGARLLAGGTRYAHPRYPRGHYFAPTLLADVTPAMRVAQEECFGPVLCFMRAPASTAAAVLALANAAPFGLGASVFGDERDPQLDAVVRGLAAGMVAVNDFGTYYAVQLPFGGVGGSGYGRFAGREGLQALCNAKSVCADRYGRWLGVRTVLPAVVRYPVASQQRAWQFVRGLVEFGYGQTVGRRLRGLVDVVRNA